MTGPDKKLIAAVEAYFADLRRMRASGGVTGERSYYPALASLLGAVGDTLKPKVFCVGELADQGAGHPDFGLYSARQVQRGRPKERQVPEHGVVEVKGVEDDVWLTVESDQVSRYWGRYRLVLVTNARDFVLVATAGSGDLTKLETFRLTESADDFLAKASIFAGLIRARRLSACPGRRGSTTARDGAVSSGRNTQHSLRGRTRGTLLPFDVDLTRCTTESSPHGCCGRAGRSTAMAPRLRAATTLARVGLAPAGTGAERLPTPARCDRSVSSSCQTGRRRQSTEWTRPNPELKEERDRVEQVRQEYFYGHRQRMDRCNTTNTISVTRSRQQAR